MVDPLDYPFLDYKGIMAVLGDHICKKDKAYALIDKLYKEKDENGNPLIDVNAIPDLGKKIVPTDLFCKKYKIKRRRKRDVPENDSK